MQSKVNIFAATSELSHQLMCII